MIIVFGSLNLDITVPVKQLPQPGETVLGPSYTTAPGGKGANQALAAQKAGANVRMVGKIGQDIFADSAIELLKENGVDLIALEKSTDSPTACALIIVDENGRNQIAVASGANKQANAEQVKEEWLTPDNLLILQMEVDPEENWKLVSRAKKKGMRVLLNLAPAGPIPEDVICQLDWLVVNEIEVLVIAKQLGFKDTDPVLAGKYIHNKTAITVIVTLGEAGARCFSRKGNYSVPSLAIKPVDTTAAGDSFVGAFAASLDSGHDLVESLCWGAVAGSLACLEYGAQTSVPKRETILTHLKEIGPVALS